jgi:Cu(I)/Ag(I) efflux system membrane protein CusA/SilA
MVGGIFTSFVLELLVYPAIYEVWRWNTAVKKLQTLLAECPNKPPAGLRLIASTPAEDATGD